MDELRPCPFCASSGIFWDRGGMECPACAARGPANEKQRVCVTAWNTRPIEDAPQDDWLQAARMEALEAEVRRLQDAEAYWTDQTYRAKFERLATAGEVYFEELRVKNADLVAQLQASQAEVERLNDALDDYGEHLASCAVFDYPTEGACTCGLTDELTPAAIVNEGG